MMIFKTSTAEWALRLSMGVMYLWSGTDIIRHPTQWTWAIKSLPAFAQNPITAFGVERFLFVQGCVEVAMAVIFICWFMPRVLVMIAALFSAVEMLSIVFLVGVDATTFRDIGLIGPGIALFILSKR